MARKVRIEWAGACYHVINRGNYRRDLFASKGATQSFQTCLFEAAERFCWRLHAFVAMRNQRSKTRLVNFQQESFRFLGCDFAWRRSPRTGNRFVHVEPSPKARLHLREAVREELNHWTKHRSCAEAVRRVNRITRGYQHCGQKLRFRKSADYGLLVLCVAHFLRRRALSMASH